MKSIVSEKGQVTIPKEMRDRLGIQAGQVLDFQEVQGKMIVTKVLSQDTLEQVFGILTGTPGSDQLMQDLRGDADSR
ncbi:MAG: AbrB/MazE/SpoVT family DNA-binding domain-containing protein [Candidatus Melainabacteria bacterium HGW-Melainabacteria-1]|nr:MAG: AbrB/MazE/SpoVT family DNA-binding domain-containing protein [Candidatus Melainabacteria bacterium HGW-Melainabacteria-1]